MQLLQHPQADLRTAADRLTYQFTGGRLAGIVLPSILGFLSLPSLFTTALLAVEPPFAEPRQVQSKLVQLGSDGRLHYQSYSDRGDKLPDFSYAGFGGGNMAIPDVPVKLTLGPETGDNRARLQAALDQLAALPPDPHGWRGALLLRSGRYEIGDTLKIRASGIVLRGAGEDVASGTVLIATKRAKHDLIVAGGTGEWVGVSATTTEMADDYVPVGSNSFRVREPRFFAVGDRVIVRRMGNAAWVAAIGMDHIPPRPDGGPIVQWQPNSMELMFDRVITAIAEDRITVDAPLTDSFRREFGGGRVYRYEFKGRLKQIGVENLRLVSEFDAGNHRDEAEGEAIVRDAMIDEKHGWNALTFIAVEDGWARHVTSVSFGNACVAIERTARRVTVQHCSCLDPVSQVTGDRRYAFPITGQLALVRDSYARQVRHAFVLESRVPGPNVFLDCRAEESYSTSEPHQRWSSGVLWDNVTVDGPNAWLQAVNRGWMGTGHGWGGAQMVFWNCRAPLIAVQRPPTAQNFAIGVSGIISRPSLVIAAVREISGASGATQPPRSPFWGDGYTESPDGPVTPRSLYLAQLADRQAQKAVAIPDSKQPARPAP